MGRALRSAASLSLACGLCLAAARASASASQAQAYDEAEAESAEEVCGEDLGVCATSLLQARLRPHLWRSRKSPMIPTSPLLEETSVSHTATSLVNSAKNPLSPFQFYGHVTLGVIFVIWFVDCVFGLAWPLELLYKARMRVLDRSGQPIGSPPPSLPVFCSAIDRVGRLRVTPPPSGSCDGEWVAPVVGPTGEVCFVATLRTKAGGGGQILEVAKAGAPPLVVVVENPGASSHGSRLEVLAGGGRANAMCGRHGTVVVASLEASAGGASLALKDTSGAGLAVLWPRPCGGGMAILSLMAAAAAAAEGGGAEAAVSDGSRLDNWTLAVARPLEGELRDGGYGVEVVVGESLDEALAVALVLAATVFEVVWGGR